MDQETCQPWYQRKKNSNFDGNGIW